VVNTGYVSTQEVVEKIRSRLLPNWNPAFWQSDDEFYRFGAVTPRSNCILDPSKLVAAGIKIRSVSEALDEAMSQWVPNIGE
jgi:UDP-glucose 4,6-dehydratase